MRLYLKNSWGFNCTELLISLALTSLLVTPALGLLGSQNKLHYLLFESNRRLAVEMQLRRAVERVISDLDTHSLPVFPRVHKAGAITHADGSRNAISDHQGTLKPDPHSDAMTSMRINLSRLVKVSAVILQGSSALYHSCALNAGAALTTDPPLSFLALTPLGVSEMSGTVTISSPRGMCWDLTLSPQAGMSTKPPDYFAPALVAALIPIESHYTLYRSQTGELRYIGHRGKENIENQPLIDRIPVLEFNLTMLRGSLVPLLITGMIWERPDTKIEFRSLATIPHQTLLNLLWNM